MRAARSLDAVGRTPLVEVPRLRPAGGARVFLKWEAANPTGSMKDRMALAMVRAAEASGALGPGQRVVEFTGGSTGASLAFVCAAQGRPVSLVTADCFSDEKIQMMRAFGADVDVLATPERKTYPELTARMRERVAEIRARTGAYWTDQLHNRDQLAGYRPMADEILADCPDVTDFVMVVGTGGCAMGNAARFREAKPAVRVTLAEPEECATLARGEKGAHGVEGIALGFRPPLVDDRLFDGVLPVPEEEGRAHARLLASSEGLLVGTSTGLNLAAAVRVARDRGPDAAVVTVAVDTGIKYLQGGLFRRGHERAQLREARWRRVEMDLSERLDLPRPG